MEGRTAKPQRRPGRLKQWAEGLTDLQKVVLVALFFSALGFGGGVRAHSITTLPRVAAENRALLASVDSVLLRHIASPAHPVEARARERADSLLLTEIHRGDSMLVVRLDWLVCVERLDRSEPATPPVLATQLCPPPGATP